MKMTSGAHSITASRSASLMVPQFTTPSASTRGARYSKLVDALPTMRPSATPRLLRMSSEAMSRMTMRCGSKGTSTSICSLLPSRLLTVTVSGVSTEASPAASAVSSASAAMGARAPIRPRAAAPLRNERRLSVVSNMRYSFSRKTPGTLRCPERRWTTMGMSRACPTCKAWAAATAARAHRSARSASSRPDAAPNRPGPSNRSTAAGL